VNGDYFAASGKPYHTSELNFDFKIRQSEAELLMIKQIFRLVFFAEFPTLDSQSLVDKITTSE